jgi:hypothetical protein
MPNLIQVLSVVSEMKYAVWRTGNQEIMLHFIQFVQKIYIRFLPQRKHQASPLQESVG